MRRRQQRHVLGVARVHQGQAGAIEMHTIEMLVVNVLSALAAVGHEVEQAVLGIDRSDPVGAEQAGRDRILESAVVFV